MNRGDLVSHIRKAWIYAKALRVEETFSCPTALDASEAFRGYAINSEASYEELYLIGLRESQYNILLKDYAYFQFGLGGLDGVRFAYYPNPFFGATSDAVAQLSDMQEYVVEGIIDVDEFLHSVSEIRMPQHPPLVRYEYSAHQYNQLTHPCSHLHLGFHGTNRWPLKRYLTAHAFTLLVFRLFYLDFWMNAGLIRLGERDLSMDSILEAARTECRILSNDEFSEAESRRFHMV